MGWSCFTDQELGYPIEYPLLEEVNRLNCAAGVGVDVAPGVDVPAGVGVTALDCAGDAPEIT